MIARMYIRSVEVVIVVIGIALLIILSGIKQDISELNRKLDSQKGLITEFKENTYYGFKEVKEEIKEYESKKCK